MFHYKDLLIGEIFTMVIIIIDKNLTQISFMLYDSLLNTVQMFEVGKII